MEITYKSKKMKSVCTDAKVADRTYGNEMAEKIQMRVDEIRAADTVEEMISKSRILWRLLIIIKIAGNE